MCLATAARVLATEGEGIARIGLIRLGGDIRRIGLALVPEAEVGTWVTIHAGYAIGVLDEEAAAELAALSDEIAGLL